jgi:ABC-type amino acid transport substrate-binding protein
MHKLKALILNILCLTLIAMPTWAAEGDDYLTPCDKVILGGDADWAPYVIINEDGVGGVGMDLATKVFAELDIPVKYVAFSNHMAMMQALRAGDFDVLVSTYPNNDLKANTSLVEPPYIVDAVTVAMKIENIPEVSSWDSLSGHHGAMDMNFTPDQPTQDFFDAYLSIKDQLSLTDAMNKVMEGKAYYVVGSELQLRYAIAKNNLQSSIAIANVKHPLPVHMAFRPDSPCQQYVAFLSKRLQDFKNDGTLEMLINKYEVNALPN